MRLTRGGGVRFGGSCRRSPSGRRGAPSRATCALEMIQPDLVLEFLILLLDRPALMGELHQGAQRGGRGQVHQVELRARRRTEIAFAQQPDFGREASLAPIVRGRDPGRAEARAPRRIRPIAPRHESPLARRLRGGPGAGLDRRGVRRSWRRVRGRPLPAAARARRGRACRGRPSDPTQRPRRTAASRDATRGAASHCCQIPHRRPRR